MHRHRICSSRALEHRLNSCGTRLSCSVACGIFRTGDQTPVFCTGRQIFYHWAPSRALVCLFSRSHSNKYRMIPHCHVVVLSTFLYICWPCVDLPWRTIYSYPLAIKKCFLFNLFFLATLGVHCCMWVLSSCSERGLLFNCGARPLIAVGSLVAALEPAGLVVVAHRCRMACGAFRPTLHYVLKKTGHMH